MPPRERAVDRGTRRARAVEAELGAEIRRARVAGSLTQDEVGRACGITGAYVSLIEHGLAHGVSITTVARVTSVVGLDLTVRVYPGGSVLRDAGHLALLERLRSAISPTLGWRTEVPLPNPGDQRAWDAMIVGRTPGRGPATDAMIVGCTPGRGPATDAMIVGRAPGRGPGTDAPGTDSPGMAAFGMGGSGMNSFRIGVEAETRPGDAQALQRRLALKRRDGGVDHVLLALAATRGNRAFLREAGRAFAPDFPVTGRDAIAALAAGRDPGGSTIVLL